MEDRYADTVFEMAQDKFINYDKNVRALIDTITRKQGAIDLDKEKVFGKHIHAFIWAFFTGVFNNKKIELNSWEYTDTFTLGVMHRDQSGIAADAMLLIAISEIKTDDFEKTFTTKNGIRKILNILSSYAEGGAKHILEIKETDGNTNYLDHAYHFHDEIKNRIKSDKKDAK